MFVARHATPSRAPHWLCLCLFLLGSLAAGAGLRRHLLRQDFREEDVRYIWLEGERVARGENPYTRVLAGDMRHNRKYPTHLPLPYLVVALTIESGVRTFEGWMRYWSAALVGFHFLVGYAALFAILAKRSGLVVALFASLFWLFNRWSLYSVRIGQLDAPAILCAVLAVHLFERRPGAAYLLLGLSLAIKHLALFLLPLFLVWEYQRGGRGAFGRSALGLAGALLVPAAVSVPFLAWDAGGFCRSILFSGTREAMANVGGYPLDTCLSLEGVAARLPLLGLLGLVYLAALRGALRPYGAVLLAQATFVGFNPVAFGQYLAWVIPFLPLAAVEWQERDRAGPPAPAGPAWRAAQEIKATEDLEREAECKDPEPGLL